MKKRITIRLRSRTGASITYALLLFLVCAVLCSVILTAATAASGRMSNLTETEQRYYTVTSAAELLKDLIDGKTVSIVEVTETKLYTTYTTTYNDDGEVLSQITTGPTPGPEVLTAIYIVPDKTKNEITESDYTYSFETNGNRYYDKDHGESFTNDSIQKDAAKRLCDAEHDALLLNSPIPDTSPLLDGRPLSLTSDHSSAALAAAISEELGRDGSIRLKVYNQKNAHGEDSSPGERYTLALSFGVDQNDGEITTHRDGGVTNVESTAYIDSHTDITIETRAKITTLTWSLNGIKIA